MAIRSGTVSLFTPFLIIFCPVIIVNSYVSSFFYILIKAFLIKDEDIKFLIAPVSNKAYIRYYPIYIRSAR